MARGPFASLGGPMSDSRGYCYEGRKFNTLKCLRCEISKPVWYFGIKAKSGERRLTCKACRAKLRHRVKVDQDQRYHGVFDGMDLDPLWDINSNEAAHKMIDRRAEAVRGLLLKESRDKKPHGGVVERTIADEIRAGKKAWRAVRRLAWAPMPLKLLESD